ncbi:MAG TPA: hypothetical protein VGJ54_11835, partial [Streptosporangiaceae bacterium]
MAVLCRLEPGLDAEVLTSVVAAVAGSARSLVQLERRLGSGGCLRTGQAGGRRLFELAGMLVAAGATRVQIPVCSACG